MRAPVPLQVTTLALQADAALSAGLPPAHAQLLDRVMRPSNVRTWVSTYGDATGGYRQIRDMADPQDGRQWRAHVLTRMDDQGQPRIVRIELSSRGTHIVAPPRPDHVTVPSLGLLIPVTPNRLLDRPLHAHALTTQDQREVRQSSCGISFVTANPHTPFDLDVDLTIDSATGRLASSQIRPHLGHDIASWLVKPQAHGGAGWCGAALAWLTNTMLLGRSAADVTLEADGRLTVVIPPEASSSMAGATHQAEFARNAHGSLDLVGALKR